jgi:hypothetical protein
MGVARHIASSDDTRPRGSEVAVRTRSRTRPEPANAVVRRLASWSEEPTDQRGPTGKPTPTFPLHPIPSVPPQPTPPPPPPWLPAATLQLQLTWHVNADVVRQHHDGNDHAHERQGHAPLRRCGHAHQVVHSVLNDRHHRIDQRLHLHTHHPRWHAVGGAGEGRGSANGAPHHATGVYDGGHGYDASRARPGVARASSTTKRGSSRRVSLARLATAPKRRPGADPAVRGGTSTRGDLLHEIGARRPVRPMRPSVRTRADRAGDWGSHGPEAARVGEI